MRPACDRSRPRRPSPPDRFVVAGERSDHRPDVDAVHSEHSIQESRRVDVSSPRKTFLHDRSRNIDRSFQVEAESPAVYKIDRPSRPRRLIQKSLAKRTRRYQPVSLAKRLSNTHARGRDCEFSDMYKGPRDDENGEMTAKNFPVAGGRTFPNAIRAILRELAGARKTASGLPDLNPHGARLLTRLRADLERFRFALFAIFRDRGDPKLMSPNSQVPDIWTRAEPVLKRPLHRKVGRMSGHRSKVRPPLQAASR
jgi:hypothetical protein